MKDWLIETRKKVSSLQNGFPSVHKFNNHPVSGPAIFLKGTKHIFHASDKQIVLRDPFKNFEILRVYSGLGSNVTAIAIDPEGRQLCSGGSDGTVAVFSIESSAPIKKAKLHEGKVFSLAFHTNDLILSGSKDKSCKLINSKTFDVLFKESFEKFVRSVALANHPFLIGQVQLLKGCADGNLSLHNFDLNLNLAVEETVFRIKPLKGEAGIKAVEFTRDGHRFLCGGKDKTMRIFEISRESPNHKPFEVYKFVEGKSIISAVTFEKSGKIMISGGTDKALVIYNGIEYSFMNIDSALGPISSINVLPDEVPRSGKLAVVTSAKRKALAVFNIYSGERLASLSQSGIRCMAPSPPEGRLVALGLDSGNLWVYDIFAEETVLYQQIHTKSILALSFSPDGKSLTTAGSDGSVYILSSDSFKLLRKFEKFNEVPIRSVGFSSDSRKLIVGSDDKLVRVFDLENKEADPLLLKDHTDCVNTIVFSPISTLMASGSSDKKINIYNFTPQGVFLRHTFSSHESVVRALDFSRNGKLLVSGSFDTNIKLYRIGEESLEETLTLKGHEDAVLTVAFSSDANYVLSGGQDKLVFLFEVATGKVLRKFTGFKSDIRSVAFQKDGARFFTASMDGLLKQYCFKSPNEQVARFSRNQSSVIAISLGAENNLITSCDDRSLRLYDLNSGLELKRYPEANGAGTSLSLSPDGARLVAAGDDKIVRVYESHSGALIKELKHHDEWVAAVAFSRDGKYFVSGGADRRIFLYEASTCELLLRLPMDSGEGEEEGNRREDVAPQGSVYCLAFSADGDEILCGGDDNLIRFYKLENNNRRAVERKPFSGHTKKVACIDVSFNGELVASGGEDKKVIVFFKNTGKIKLSFLGHEGPVTSLKFCKVNHNKIVTS